MRTYSTEVYWDSAADLYWHFHACVWSWHEPLSCVYSAWRLKLKHCTVVLFLLSRTTRSKWKKRGQRRGRMYRSSLAQQYNILYGSELVIKTKFNLQSLTGMYHRIIRINMCHVPETAHRSIMGHFTQLRVGYIRKHFNLVFSLSLQMANGSIDVAPVGCHQMNYVTVSVGYEGDCAGEKVLTLLSWQLIT